MLCYMTVTTMMEGMEKKDIYSNSNQSNSNQGGGWGGRAG